MGTWYVNRMSFEILEIASKCSLDSYEQTGDNTISATYNATMIMQVLYELVNYFYDKMPHY
jgi:hypothetical protein